MPSPLEKIPSEKTGHGSFGVSALGLLGLASFAVGQPILDLLGAKPEFFAVRRSMPVDVVVLAFLACAGPALPLLGIELVLGKLGARWREAAHFAFVALLTALVALPPLNRSLDVESAIGPLLGAVAIGLVVAAAASWFHGARWFLAFLATGVLFFPLMFGLRPGVFKILAGGVDEVVPLATSPPESTVVLVIFDELPLSSLLEAPEAFDAVRYPHFAALANEATWYRRASTVSDFTVQAVPAILTGRYPRPDLLPIATDHPDNLMTLLGYPGAVNVREAITHLCPTTVCTDRSSAGFFGRQASLWRDAGILYLHMLAPADWSSALPPVHQNWMLFDNNSDWFAEFKKKRRGERQQRLDEFLDGIQPSERGSLHVLHTLLPHGPFDHLPSGRRYSRNGTLPGTVERTTRDPVTALHGYQRHLLQVGYADRVLGQVINRLRAADLYDRSLLVVTADHGADFLRPGQQRRHLTEANTAEIVPVPLLIKTPFQTEPTVDARLVETVDILPTLADHLGVEVPWQMDGHSLLDPRPVRDGITFFRHRAKSRERQILSPERLDLGAFLDRKSKWLGTGADSGDPYRVRLRPELLGREVDELPTAETLHAATLDLPVAALHLEPDPGFVPSHVEGRVERRGGPPVHPAQVAVAVNGRLQVVGETQGGQAAGRFSLLIPEDAFQTGHNELELFEIVDAGIDASGGEGEFGSVRLARLAPTVSCRDLRTVDLLDPSLVHQGFEVSGLHEPGEWDGIGRVRWTQGRAEVRVPPRLRDRAEAVELDLVVFGPGERRLRISIGGREVVSQPLDDVPPGEPWTLRVPLDPGTLGDLHLVLETDAFVPSEIYEDSADGRSLGVALARFELVLEQE